MSYSIRNIFKQEPVTIKTALVTVLGVLVMAGVFVVESKLLAGIGIAVEVVLNLFYIRPLSVNKDKLEQLSDAS